MGIKVHPILLEPEVHSVTFVFGNLLFSILLFAFNGGWPLSFFSSCLYLVFVVAVNYVLASGSHYSPTKNLNGQTVVITGAATGIGRASAVRFAKLSARVIIGIRGQERAERIARELVDESNGGTVIGYDLDLSSFEKIRNFAAKIDRVDILVNNAGALHESFALTSDGIEKQFGTNHIGHFYLTKLLLPLLAEGRVVNVSSLAHHFVKPVHLDYSFERLKGKYSGIEAYGLSKIAQIYHASELKRRHGLKAYSLHPGTIANTELNHHRPWYGQVAIQIFRMVSKSVEQGAMTTLYCALSDEARPGEFHSDCQVRRPTDLALDQRRAEECWNASERLLPTEGQ